MRSPPLNFCLMVSALAVEHHHPLRAIAGGLEHQADAETHARCPARHHPLLTDAAVSNRCSAKGTMGGTPAGTDFEAPQNALEDTPAAAGPWPSGTASLWEQRLDESPLIITDKCFGHCQLFTTWLQFCKNYSAFSQGIMIALLGRFPIPPLIHEWPDCARISVFTPSPAQPPHRPCLGQLGVSYLYQVWPPRPRLVGPARHRILAHVEKVSQSLTLLSSGGSNHGFITVARTESGKSTLR